MRRFGMFLFGLVLVLGLVAQAGAQTTTLEPTTTSTSTSTSSSTSTSTSTLPAATWNVIRNSDCTGAEAASGVTSAVVNCCQGAGTGFCDKRDTFGGTLFSRNVTLATGAGQAYSTSGNVLNAANQMKLNLGNVVSFTCSPSTAGHGVRVNFASARGKRSPTIWLWNGTTQISAATDIGNISTDCFVTGY